MTVTGGVGVVGATYIGGVVNITNNTASTSTTTGALTVAGGVGVVGATYIGGVVNITNNTQTSGPSGPAALVVTGGVGIGLGLSVGGTLNVGTSSISTFTGGINAASFNATSDYRIKHNVRLLGDDPSFNVDVLRPVTYTNSRVGKQDIGFIAHEVGEHYPYLVNGDKDGIEMQSLNYTGIIGILVKEIQELKKQVAQLNARF